MARAKKTARKSTRRAAPRTRRAASNDAIALLKADHREVEGWFEQFESARSTVAARKSLARKICQALKVHTQIEHEIFYPGISAGHGRGRHSSRGGSRAPGSRETHRGNRGLRARRRLLSRQGEGSLRDDQASRERRGKTGWYVCRGAEIRHGSRGSRRAARRPQGGVDGPVRVQTAVAALTPGRGSATRSLIAQSPRGADRRITSGPAV